MPEAASLAQVATQPFFFSRLAVFFSAAVFSGFFLVCFWEFCVLAMVRFEFVVASNASRKLNRSEWPEQRALVARRSDRDERAFPP